MFLFFSKGGRLPSYSHRKYSGFNVFFFAFGSLVRLGVVCKSRMLWLVFISWVLMEYYPKMYLFIQ